jgi:oxygen-independent coproporphyrinogen-3 oxidase
LNLEVTLMDRRLIERAREELDTLQAEPGYSKFLRKREKYFLNVIYPPREYMSPLDDAQRDEILAFSWPWRAALYFHIPFCPYFCHFCHYYKVIGSREDVVAHYLDALKAEIAMIAPRLKNHSVESVYFGGGTPSYLSAEQIINLLRFIRQSFSIRDGAEVTFEVNPTNASPEKFRALAEGGITRVSIGIQSFQDRVNLAANRWHSVEEALTAYKQAHEAGFVNVTIDLINGLMLQTIADWMENLEYVERLLPMGVTIYYLRIRDRTPTGKTFKARQDQYPSENELILRSVMSEIALDDLGYTAPVVDYFVRDEAYGHQFDLQVWGRTEAQSMVGFGVSAYSFAAGNAGYQYANVDNLRTYIDTVLGKRELPLAMGYKLSREERMKRSLFLGLKSGISHDYWQTYFGQSIQSIFPEILERFLEAGVIALDDSCLRLTPLGRLFADEVGQGFIMKPRSRNTAMAIS